jgi:hypothetical protein
LAVSDAVARSGAPQPTEDDAEEHGEHVAMYRERDMRIYFDQAGAALPATTQ